MRGNARGGDLDTEIRAERLDPRLEYDECPVAALRIGLGEEAVALQREFGGRDPQAVRDKGLMEGVHPVHPSGLHVAEAEQGAVQIKEYAA